MSNDRFIDTYPVGTVFISSLVSLAIYASGAYILFQVNIILFILYILMVLLLEVRLLKTSCKDCWYHGKVCAFGKGRLACLISKKGNPEDFAKRPVNWISIVPDILVMAVPVISAIVLMIIDFHWLLPVLTVLIVLLSSVGNGYVRGKLACRYCRQRAIGCPASRLFDRTAPDR